MAFAYYRALTVDHTKIGASDLTSFPVGIIGTYSWLATVANGGRVQNANGYDIRPYADAAGTTPLDFELVSYNATTGALEMWVRLPSLSHTADTTIYLFHGDASISTNGSSAATWDAGFIAVYHFGAGGTLGLADSTSHGYALTNDLASAGTGTVGPGAVSFSPPSDLLGPSSIPMGATPDMTISFWAKPTGGHNSFTSLISKGAATNDTGQHDWSVTYDSSLDDLYLIRNGGNVVHSVSTLPLNVWTYFVGTMNDVASKMYFNGALDATGTQGGIGTGNTLNTSTRALSVGSDRAVYFAGLMDEVRISNAIRSADWVTAEYNNQSSPATFYAVGGETPTSTLQRLARNAGGLILRNGGGGTLTNASDAPAGGASATGTATLPSLTAAGSAQALAKAQSTATLPHLTSAGTAAALARSSGTASLPHLTASGSAQALAKASGTATLPHLTASGAAQAPARASGGATLPHLTAAGSATVGNVASAQGSVTLPHLVASGAALAPTRASGTATMPSLRAAAAAVVFVRASGAATLPHLTAVASAIALAKAGGAVALPHLVAGGVAQLLARASGLAVLPSLAATGHATLPGKQTASLTGLVAARPRLIGSASVTPALVGTIAIRTRYSGTITLRPAD